MWLCARRPAVNSQHCRTLSLFMPRDPSFIGARKVSRPCGSEQRTCRGGERWRGRTASSTGEEFLLLVSAGGSVTSKGRESLLYYLSTGPRAVGKLLLHGRALGRSPSKCQLFLKTSQNQTKSTFIRHCPSFLCASAGSEPVNVRATHRHIWGNPTENEDHTSRQMVTATQSA